MRVKTRRMYLAFGSAFILGLPILFLYLPFLKDRLALLDDRFRTNLEFRPTRIYSELSCLPIGAPRAEVVTILKSLGMTIPNEQTVSLRWPKPPADALPLLSRHPYSPKENEEITLEFSDSEKTATPILSGIKGSSVENYEEICGGPHLLGLFQRANSLETKIEHRTRLAFDDIPSMFWQAVLAVEDPRYLEHHGLDPKGVLRALIVNLRTLRLAQGGSTITGQLVKNLLNRTDRNLFLKFHELFFSLWLEAKYGKQAILERYLNEVYLGNQNGLEIHGIAEATKLYFQKAPNEISLPEAATLAAMIKGPGYYSPFQHPERLRERGTLVLDKMLEHGFIAKEEHKLAVRARVEFKSTSSVRKSVQGFLDAAFLETKKILGDQYSDQDIMGSGLKVFTTLDWDMQKLAQSVASNAELAPELELALVTVSNETGQVKTWVGSRKYSASQYDRVSTMRRQLGSTFKPIVYLTALQAHDTRSNESTYHQATPVYDGPLLVKQKGLPNWRPENYTKSYLGWIPFGQALALSINTVSVRLLHDVGFSATFATARALGFMGTLPEVPSLALGVSESSPLDLVQTYSTLVRLGQNLRPSIIARIEENDGSVLYAAPDESELTASTYSDSILLLEKLLVENTITGSAKAIQNSRIKSLIAGKTGTTSDGRDAWFVGYSPQFTTALWVGEDTYQAPSSEKPETSTKKQNHLTGAGAALPLWIKYTETVESLKGFGMPTNYLQRRNSSNSILAKISVDPRNGKITTPEACPGMGLLFEGYALLAHLPDEKKSCEDSAQFTEIREVTF